MKERLLPLSEAELDRRYVYSYSVPLFDVKEWQNQGWEHRLSYRRPSANREFNHEQIVMRETNKYITCRMLPIHVEYVDDVESGSITSNWYVNTGQYDQPEQGISDDGTVGAQVLAEAESVYQMFLAAAEVLEARGLITVDFIAGQEVQHLQLADTNV